MLNTPNDVDDASLAFQQVVQVGQQLLIMHLYSDAGVMDVGPNDVVMQGEKLQEALTDFLMCCRARPSDGGQTEEE